MKDILIRLVSWWNSGTRYHQTIERIVADAAIELKRKPEPGPATRAMLDNLTFQLGPANDYAVISLDREDAEKFLAEWKDSNAKTDQHA